MQDRSRLLQSRNTWLAFSLMMFVAAFGISSLSTESVSANHPVLVEGNCDSPSPGTTIVNTFGTCGDYDGDGRIGTSEDTDGADRIFGTISAALGPGTGAAAGTGANFNGTITIVGSGRFAESVNIINGTQGNVTLQAAPGVEAQIDAVLQGDPAGGNNSRQTISGIFINIPATGRVILRNLTIRNWAVGITAAGSSQVTVDNCRVENNLNYGIRAIDSANIFIANSRVHATGYRVGSAGTCPSGTCTPSPGQAIAFEVNSSGSVFHSEISGNFGAAINNASSLGASAVRYYEVFTGQNGGGINNATRENAP